MYRNDGPRLVKIGKLDPQKADASLNAFQFSSDGMIRNRRSEKPWDFPMKNVDFPMKNMDFPMKDIDFLRESMDFPRCLPRFAKFVFFCILWMFTANGDF